MPAAQLTDIHRSEYEENAWLGLGDTFNLTVDNPLLKKELEDIERPHIHLLSLLRRPENFAFTCKHVFNKTPLPMQLAILYEMWTRPFPMLIGSRGLGKSFLLALYSMLRALLCQGSKIVVVGSAFRQSKIIFDYCDEIWSGAPVLRDLAGGRSRHGKNGPRRDIDRCTLRVGESIIIALPMGDGSKIRGQRANIIIADEFAAQSVEIFENVVAGFAAVSMDPVEKVKEAGRKRARLAMGVPVVPKVAAASVPGLDSNQTIISGTAYYGFNHFFSYWKRWKAIVESRGDERKLKEIFNGEIPQKFNWRDYSVIRVPYELAPEGLMDVNTVAKAKATIHITQYLLEFSAVFATDSNGFYRRSLVESCVVGKPGKPISAPSCGEVKFGAAMRGQPGRKHVMAVDPASEKDNFSVVILELWPDHRRIVHCWAMTRSRYKNRLKKGLTEEEDFYGYCTKKMRELHAKFPCVRIAIDSQGGGVAVLEALGDSKRIEPHERLLLPVIDPDDPKDSDGVAGEHIIEMVQFARAEWVAEANHGMRLDFQDKVLLFPEYSPAELGLAFEADKAAGLISETGEPIGDTLEGCLQEIEDLKDELTTIVHTQTGTSLRDRWDTPEVKLPGSKKGRMRKDRYSALLMANMVARVLQSAPEQSYAAPGGFAHRLVAEQPHSLPRAIRGAQPGYPEWYSSEAMGAFTAVKRGGV